MTATYIGIWERRQATYWAGTVDPLVTDGGYAHCESEPAWDDFSVHEDPADWGDETVTTEPSATDRAKLITKYGYCMMVLAAPRR